MGSNFKVYVSGGREFFVWECDTAFYATKKEIKKDFELSQSLLDLLYMNMNDYFDVFNRMGKDVQSLDSRSDTAREIPPTLISAFDTLAGKHIFFELLRLDWFDRLDRYTKGESITFRYKDLTHIPMNIITFQNGMKAIFSKVLDVLSSDKPIQKKMSNLYKDQYAGVNSRFAFKPISTNFERVDSSTFAEVLYPKTIGDIVDFFLREIVKREFTFKQCRSCGKYFPAITAHGNSEYCNRLFQDTGKTCKEIGSAKVYQAKVENSPAIQAYNRAYKTHFARIKYKKMTKEDFQAWAEEARKFRDETTAGKMSLDEYEDWLKR
ncbi:MAG: hypothetical protein A2Y17_10220 [Clostridiales bacterium GWF2_38_85]|nr:MAG: hypothetical protein A2Y17_10220 [Clostridiales bacterium GWF2_38_85]HBL83298.1 hypothetical protein [Clostridiales bacterium]